ncbi:MAG: sulfatase [Planctomycetota bacterium]|jgi:arylsulfatase A-like enzyme|nr:sulfatase [Planctomycetota bacterium]MDP6763742.1 sulfatase [Planctomycetota bacterium]MDP6989232.1 sulfatase [Planctomycetota bacterium]
MVSHAPRALFAAALLAACAPDAAEAPRPNVLLISIDTLRADHLSCYGYARETSPRLDALAREGVLFESATSTTSWTLPAHVSMLTGLPVSAHGICDDRLWSRPAPDGGAEPVTMRGLFLPEVLRDAGWRTGGFFTWKYLEPTFGFGPGFEVYERLGHTFYSHPVVSERFEALRATGDTEGLQRLAAEHPELFDDTRPSSPEAVDRALGWIEAVRRDSPERPFFCFLHLFDVHDPYRAPEPFHRRFADPAYDGPITGRNVMGAGTPVERGMAEADLGHLVSLYDGEIAWVDSEVGRLLDALEARGLTQNTLVVVVSDHGEEFFEHGEKQHRRSLYRESVHVPWIARWPDGLPAGRRVAGPVGLVDVTPTITGLCGLAPPPGAVGRDLSAVARGQAPNEPTTYLSELFLFDRPGAPLRLVGLHHGDEHALLGARGAAAWVGQHIDLTVDPTERGFGERFRIEEGPGPRWDARLEALRSTLGPLASRLPSRLADDATPGLTDAELAELEAMGYTGTGEVESGAGGDRLCIDGCVWPD